MGIRKLTQAELRQRRESGKLGGRPRKSAGYRAARRAVEAARRLGQAAQPEAAKLLIAGMHGQLPGQTTSDQINCAREVLSRWGNPPLLQTKELGTKADTHLHIGLEGAVFPPAPDAPAADDDPDRDRA